MVAICGVLSFLLGYITEQTIMFRIGKRNGMTPENTGSMDDLPLRFVALVVAIVCAVVTVKAANYSSQAGIAAVVLTMPAVGIFMLVLKYGIAGFRLFLRLCTGQF